MALCSRLWQSGSCTLTIPVLSTARAVARNTRLDKIWKALLHPVISAHCRRLMPVKAVIQCGAAPSRGTVGNISAADLAELLANDDAAGSVQLIDVREEHEHEAASLPGFQLLPLSRCAIALPTLELVDQLGPSRSGPQHLPAFAPSHRGC